MMNHGDPTLNKQLEVALLRIKDLTAWAVIKGIDPWVMRQALIIALVMDSKSARERGVDPLHIQRFDADAVRQAEDWIEEWLGVSE